MERSFMNGFVDELEKISEDKDKTFLQKHWGKLLGGAVTAGGLALGGRYAAKRWRGKNPASTSAAGSAAPSTPLATAPPSSLGDRISRLNQGVAELKSKGQDRRTRLDDLTRQVRGAMAQSRLAERKGRNLAREEGILHNLPKREKALAPRPSAFTHL